MSAGDNNVAKFRVELVGKNELRDFFARTQAEAKQFAERTKSNLKGAGEDVSRMGKTVVDTAGRVREATNRMISAGAHASARQLGGVLLGLGGNAEAARRNSVALAGALGGELRSALGTVGSTAATAAKGLLALTGIGAGIGAANIAKQIIELDDGIAGLAATAGMADGEIAGLRDQIIDTSVATKTMGTSLTEALSVFVAKTGDIETARKNLKLYGDTAKATRANVVEIATIGADLRKLGITDQGSAFGILAKQADVGQVELKDIVSQGPRLLAAFMGAGLNGERGLREGGALAQVAQGATGNVERTSTSVEAVFRDLAEKSAKLSGIGVEVFNPKTGLANNRVDALLQTIRRTGGREKDLRDIFGDEAWRAVNPLATEFRATGGFGTYEKFRDVANDPALMARKLQLNTSTAAAKLDAAQVQIQADAYRNFATSVNKAVEQVDKLTAALKWAVEHPLATGGLAIGGMVGAGLARRGASAAWDAVLGRLAGTNTAGRVVAGVLGGAAGGQGTAVYVTNWPGSLGGGGVPGGLPIPSVAAGASMGSIAAGGMATIVGAAVSVIAAGAAGVALGAWLDQKYKLSDRAVGVRADGYHADPTNFADDKVGRRAAALGQAEYAKKLKAKVQRGEMTAEAAALQFERYATSSERAGDFYHTSDGTTRELYNSPTGVVALNARALRDDLRNSGVDSGKRRSAQLAAAGPGARGTLAENVGLMFDLVAGPGARDAAGALAGRAARFAAPAFGAADNAGAGFNELLGKIVALFEKGPLSSEPPKVDLQLSLMIAGEEATLQSSSGTRSATVMVKRTQGGG